MTKSCGYSNFERLRKEEKAAKETMKKDKLR